MKIPGLRCPTCGTQTADREVADDEVCACGSRLCLLRSAQICITLNRPRTGTQRVGKRPDAPPRDRMLASPGVKK